MRLISSPERSIAAMARPINAWFDRGHDEWAVAILLLLFVPVWALFHTLSHASVDLHPGTAAGDRAK
jgi:hypothetical protein